MVFHTENWLILWNLGHKGIIVFYLWKRSILGIEIVMKLRKMPWWHCGIMKNGLGGSGLRKISYEIYIIRFLYMLSFQIGLFLLKCLMKYPFLLPILLFMISMRLYKCLAGYLASALLSEKMLLPSNLSCQNLLAGRTYIYVYIFK